MSVSFNAFQPFIENLGKKLIDLSGSGLKIALTNTLPVNTQGEFAPGSDHPPPAADNGYAPTQAVVSSCAQTAGILKLVLADVVFTATAGGIGPFRYAILYDDDSTGDKLIGWYDYGSSITLAEGETFTVDFDAETGALTIGPAA